MLLLKQKLGFSNKTYSLFKRLPYIPVKRKGHLLHNPTDDQIRETEEEYIRKAKIQWRIEYNVYPSEWAKRPVELIDALVIGATDMAAWNSKNLYDFDTSTKNNVIPGKALPGISYHLFINSNGVIEQTAEYEDLIWHTSGVNYTSLGIVIQYGITNNSAMPTQKVMQSLEKILTILCLQFKLNPYKAIKGQSEISKKIFPFTKGHKSLESISPGMLISMNELRRRIAINLNRKLKSAETVRFNSITPDFTSDSIEALNKFKSISIRRIYKNTPVEVWK